jgi:hypothetical protein
VNRGQITKRVIQILGLDDTVGGEEVTLVHDLIDEGILDISRRTKLNLRCVNLHIPAGNSYFELDEGILTMMDLRLMPSTSSPNPNGKRMTQAHADEVLDDTSGLSFSIVGYNGLLLAGGTDSDRTLKAWYVPRPLRMSDDSQSPADSQYGNLPEEFHNTALLNYVLWNGADYGDDITSQSGEHYRMLYEGQDGRGGNLQDIHKMINRRATPGGRRGQLTDSYVSYDYITTGGF